jgi:hypothetical protein
VILTTLRDRLTVNKQITQAFSLDEFNFTKLNATWLKKRVALQSRKVSYQWETFSLGWTDGR